MVDLKIELPDGFLEEEVRCGYTVTGQMKEVWAVELDLLSELVRVCHRHNIEYFADGGTILGAVRHAGFIPWDDDIDIAMERSQYEKLCKYAYEFKEPYFFQTDYTDPGSLRGHAQLRNSNTTGILVGEENLWFNQGIFIDIFPLDNVCEDVQRFNKQMKQIKHLKRMAYRFGRMQASSNNKIKKALCVPSINKRLFLKLEKIYYKKFEHKCQIYNGIQTQKISLLSFQCDWARLIRNKSSYKEVVMMPFEFIQIPLPIGYEEVLTNLYGDYHEIVMNSSAHGSVFFDTNVSYRNYLRKRNEG